MPSAWMIWMIWMIWGRRDAFGMDDLDDLDDLGGLRAEDGNCAHESTAGDGGKDEEIPRRWRSSE
jgi:hypothetical protein